MTTKTKLVPLFGTGYASPWASVSAQKMVNMFPRKNGDRSDVSYIHTPGYTLVGTGPEGTTYPCRGAITATNGMVLAAFKNKVYRYEGAITGWTQLTGTLNNSSGSRVYFAQSANEILFTDGEKLWRISSPSSLSSFSQVTLTPTSLGSIAYIANRFVIADRASAKFYWSELDDGNTWDALSFASMEAEPGNIVYVMERNGILYTFGYLTTEFWAPVAGDVFQRIGASGLPFGVGGYGSYYSPLSTESGIYMMGVPLNGGLHQPYRIENLGAQALTDANTIQPFHAATSEISYYSYKVNGEEFVVFNVESSSTPAMQYNVATNTWSQLGEADVWPINASCWLTPGFGATATYYLLFDKTTSAKVFKLSSTTYTTNSTAITRKLVTRHVLSDLNPITIHELILDTESGVGTSGGDATPTVKLEVSYDDGHTFVDYGTSSFGASGEYKVKPTWYRLGTSVNWVFRFTTTNGVPFIVNGGAIRISS